MKYKNLLLQKNLSSYKLQDFLCQISLNKKKLKQIESLLQGVLQSKLSGSGFDFNEIREYHIGDDLRHISWAATAKTNTLQTKEYYAEKEVYSYFLIDISNSMFCGNKLEPFIQMIALLLNTASSFSEKIGGIFFADKITFNFPFLAAKTQVNLMFDSLISYYHNLKSKNQDFFSFSTSTNLIEPLEYARRYFSRRGLVFVVSDFLNASSAEKAMFEAAQKQNMYLFQIYDHLDFALPQAGYVSFVDPETKELFTVNTDNKIIREKYCSLMKGRQNKLKTFIETMGAHHMFIEKDDFS